MKSNFGGEPAPVERLWIEPRVGGRSRRIFARKREFLLTVYKRACIFPPEYRIPHFAGVFNNNFNWLTGLDHLPPDETMSKGGGIAAPINFVSQRKIRERELPLPLLVKLSIEQADEFAIVFRWST